MKKEEKMKIIKKVSAVIALVGLIGGLLFLSSNITGYALSGLTQVATNIIGGSLFIAGILGSYFWFKNR